MRSKSFRLVAGFLSLALAAPLSAQINLSDIVAGGDGTGLGWTAEDDVDLGGDKFAGVNLDNGTFMSRAEVDQFHNGTSDTDGLNPSPVDGATFFDPLTPEVVEPAHFMIDSVFFLPTLDVPLNLEGVTFPYLAGDEWGNSWNHVLSNRTHDIDKGREDIFAGGSAAWNTGLGIHASAGITFNLDEIRLEHGEDEVVSFSTFIGADRCGALINFYVIFSDDSGVIDDPNGNTSFINGDGDEIRYWVEASSPTSAAQYIAEIPEGAVYLTLTVGAGGNGIGCDHGVLANPQILSFVPPVPVENLSCVKNPDNSVDLTWENTNENPPPDPIRILVDGEEVGTVANDATSFTIDEAPDGDFQVCVENGAPFPSCCRPSETEANGRIKDWLVVGPFTQSFDCNAGGDQYLQNFIAPSSIQCLYPEAGDTIEYDPVLAASDSHIGTVDDNLDPMWRVFDDGSNEGALDLNAEAANNGWQNDQVMAWMVTYVTWDAPDALLNLCINSDDAVQVWIDEELVWNNGVCRGWGAADACQDLVEYQMTTGPHRIAIAAWENGGGWGLRFGFQDEFLLPIVAGLDSPMIFHGTSRPDGLEPSATCGEVECQEILVRPGASFLGVGQELALQAICQDATGLQQDVTADATWSVQAGGEDVVSVSPEGLVTALASGTATVTADLEGLSGDATIEVARLLSLADMVVGGDGTGPGGAPVDDQIAGIDLDTGALLTYAELQTLNMNTVDADGVNPAPVVDAPLVDSVFLLQDAFTPITTANADVLWTIGDEWPNSYNHVLSNLTHRIDAGDTSIVAAGQSFATGIGIHAAAGISFDLEAIREEHGEDAVDELVVFLGADECAAPNLSLNVIFSDDLGVIEDPLAEELNPPPLDGIPLPYVRVIGDAQDIGVQYRGAIPPEATYLTFAAGANGDGIGCDHAVFADPFIIGGDGGSGDGPEFRRGDVDGSGTVDISDPIANLTNQFLGGPIPCRDAADYNDSGAVDISDPIANLTNQFLGGPPAAPPGSETCGPDPTPDVGADGDDLGCENPPTNC